ncbi:hypothetical protein EII29_01260 [Leptotrichia sp. OH3620_COT-345]|uniref:hypothetical protein n=1 Tax=Leptotrichia sp. OH3620_COT-345 TaxID=2491048 RepID=UPI000F64FAD8|nr:hypothetical protein [Leptotrichia sp. OH3620_COT-345]RRD40599.1 hypothetical protein EII29_01260 [Leptotrichia sp. OH3620_COT-345]
MKKILTILFLIINIMTFSTSDSQDNCENQLSDMKIKLLAELNYGRRGNMDQSYKSYDTIVNNYNLAIFGRKSVSCHLNVVNHLNLINKIKNIQQTLNSQINNNFNGKRQIPYNQNYTYNGHEYEYEIKRGDIEDSSGNTYTTEKKQSNTALEGTDHAGLIKYMYGIAGISTAAFNELDLEDFAAMTKYQLKQGMPLRPGDLIIMNYKNNSSIDTVGLVYQDTGGQLKMLEMGGNMYEEGSSVKSFVPMTDANNTAYVVPFETVISKAYFIDDETNIAEREDIKKSVYSRGKILNLPSVNPKITTYSMPRNQVYLAYNGFTSADPLAEATENINQENIIKEITGMTGNFFSTANKGMAGFSTLIMAIMVFLITINVLWTVFKGGLHGSLEEIIKSILGQIAQKAPYFVFVALYPVLMKNVVMPLFLHKLPTHLFGSFINASKIPVENGKYVTYSDLIVHIVKKGMPLIIGTFGAGVMKQKESISGLFRFFSTIWKVIGGWFSGDVSVLEKAWETFGLLFSISRVIMQAVIFRPITSLAGLMTIITLLNIALNIFLSSLTFIISTSVGLFYMIFGMNDITKSKALNTLQIIISGFLQYLVNFGVIIVLAMIIEMIGKSSLGVILTPFNFVNTIKVFLCISIIQSVVKQVGVSIAINF